MHGPHDHEVGHAVQREPTGMAGQIAVVSAVLATIGALFAYAGGATQASAGLCKNEAAIKKTEASSHWNFWQETRAPDVRCQHGARRARRGRLALPLKGARPPRSEAARLGRSACQQIAAETS